jgi:hypothetical protein
MMIAAAAAAAVAAESMGRWVAEVAEGGGNGRRIIFQKSCQTRHFRCGNF